MDDMLGLNLEDLKQLSGVSVPILVMALVEAFKAVPRWGSIKALYLPLAMVLGSLGVILLYAVDWREGIKIGIIVGCMAGGAQNQISSALKNRLKGNGSSSIPTTG